jgi:hypothetical protein
LLCEGGRDTEADCAGASGHDAVFAAEGVRHWERTGVG